MILVSSSAGAEVVTAVSGKDSYDPAPAYYPDATFLYEILPSFFRVIGRPEVFSAAWSGSMSVLSSALLAAWQTEASQSLAACPIWSQRHWAAPEFWRTLATSGAVRSQTGGSALLSAPLRVPASAAGSWFADADIEVSTIQPGGAVLLGYEGAAGVHVLLEATSASEVSISLTNGTAASRRYLPGTVTAGMRVHLEITVLEGCASLTATDAQADLGTVLLQTVDDTSSVAAGTLLSGSLAVGDTLTYDGVSVTVLGLTGDIVVVSAPVLPPAATLLMSRSGPASLGTASLSLAGLEDMLPTAFSVRPATRGEALTYGLLQGRSLYVSVSATFLDPTLTDTTYAIPFLRTLDGTYTWEEGIHFFLASPHQVTFSLKPPARLWADYIAYDGRLLSDVYGVLVGERRESSVAYQSVLTGLSYAFLQGPTVGALESAVSRLLGLPVADEAGTVTAVEADYSGKFGRVYVGSTSYLYPTSLGTTVVVGDVVGAQEPLAPGVRIVDIVVDPYWAASRADVHSLQAVHGFEVQVPAAFITQESLASVQQFVNVAKPAHTQAYYRVVSDVEDLATPEDTLTLDVGLELYDIPYDPPWVVRYDEPAPWSYDMQEVPWSKAAQIQWATGTPLLGDGVIVSFLAGSAVIVDPDDLLTPSLVAGDTLIVRRVHTGYYTASAGSYDVVIEDDVSSFVRIGDTVHLQGDTLGERVAQITAIAGFVLTLSSPSSADDSGSLIISSSTFHTAKVQSVASGSVTLDGAPGVQLDAYIRKGDPAFVTAHYDSFEDVRPIEDLGFDLTLDASYAGALPVLADLPVSRTETATFTFTEAGQTQGATVYGE